MRSGLAPSIRIMTRSAALAALHSGALGTLAWAEVRPLSDGARAFDDLDKGRTAAAKVVLVPNG